MSEYQKMMTKMVEEHKELFDNFKDIHNEYAMNPAQWQKLFNQYGGEVVEIIRECERRLCANMATGKYVNYVCRTRGCQLSIEVPIIRG